MKKQIKKIAQLTVVFCFAVATLASCGDADEEIFNNTDLQAEQETDEEEDKKEEID